MAAEGTALVSSAAPPTKRRVLRHFETSLVLSTSTALTGPQKEKIVARLSRAGESMMARARGDFVDTRCKGATPAERAAVDECVRSWFDAGVHDGFKALYSVLDQHTKLKLPKALELEDAAANDKYGQVWCEIFAPLHLVKVLRKLKRPLLPPGGCAVCLTEDDSVGGRIFSCSHRLCGKCYLQLPKTAVLADGRAAPCCPLCRRACPKTTGWHGALAPGGALLAAR